MINSCVGLVVVDPISFVLRARNELAPSLRNASDLDDGLSGIGVCRWMLVVFEATGVPMALFGISDVAEGKDDQCERYNGIGS